jgi:hypothetical protein
LETIEHSNTINNTKDYLAPWNNIMNSHNQRIRGKNKLNKNKNKN